MEKNKLKKLHIATILIGIIFVNLSIFHENIWFDECYSIGLAGRSFAEIWSIGAHDVHPILYYWILHIIFSASNGSILLCRIFSGIIISITGILGFTHIRKDFGEKTGLIFSFLIYFSPITALFAGEIRMYSIALFLITIIGIYAYRLSKEQKISYWVIFFISTVFALNTHYYALMAAGIINIILLIYFIKNKNKKAYITQIILGIFQILFYLPWMINFLSQLKTMSSNGFWISITFPQTLIEILGFQFACQWEDENYLKLYIGFAVSILIYIYCLYILIKTKDNKPAICCVIIYISVILASLIISKVLNSAILYYRYLFVLTGLSFFAISYLLAKGKTRYTVIICAIILISGIANNVFEIIENYDSSNDEPIQFLEENIEENDVIISPNIGVGSVIAVKFPEYKFYFYNKSNWGVEEAYKAFGYNFTTNVTLDFLEEIKESDGRIWILTSGKSKIYEKYFDNEDYELILTKEFETSYENYFYKYYLVEYIGD